MVTGSHSTRVFARLEWIEALRTRWAFVAALLDLAAVAGFLWYGLKESSVLGFTGLSRVTLNVASLLVIAMPLVALLATAQSLPRARSSGFFELFLAQPVRRTTWFDGLAAARAAVLLGPLVGVLLIAMLAAWVSGDLAGIPSILRSLALAMALVVAFLGIGLYLSSWSKTAERALVLALVVWAGASALHDFALIGILLRVRLPPHVVFLLAALNPSELVRVGILGASDPELSVLGPVGFWIANGLGARALFALALAWPLLIGTLAMWRARCRFGRADLVG